ncbi:hypothetical protein N9Y94_03020 [Alphaproteobacteria bacterium]|nr:hypothetical protein [Alphaproteobacteria bacterium]
MTVCSEIICVEDELHHRMMCMASAYALIDPRIANSLSPLPLDNQRTAFAVTYTFLLINNILVTADTGQIWQFLHKNYETGRMRYDILRAWLQENTHQT